jgi:hypothetical protein
VPLAFEFSLHNRKKMIPRLFPTAETNKGGEAGCSLGVFKKKKKKCSVKQQKHNFVKNLKQLLWKEVCRCRLQVCM